MQKRQNFKRFSLVMKEVFVALTGRIPGAGVCGIIFKKSTFGKFDEVMQEIEFRGSSGKLRVIYGNLLAKALAKYAVGDDNIEHAKEESLDLILKRPFDISGIEHRGPIPAKSTRVPWLWTKSEIFDDEKCYLTSDNFVNDRAKVFAYDLPQQHLQSHIATHNRNFDLRSRNWASFEIILADTPFHPTELSMINV